MGSRFSGPGCEFRVRREGAMATIKCRFDSTVLYSTKCTGLDYAVGAVDHIRSDRQPFNSCISSYTHTPIRTQYTPSASASSPPPQGYVALISPIVHLTHLTHLTSRQNTTDIRRLNPIKTKIDAKPRARTHRTRHLHLATESPRITIQ